MLKEHVSCILVCTDKRVFKSSFFNMSEQHLRESTTEFLSGAEGMAAKCYETLEEEMKGCQSMFVICMFM